MDSKELRLIKEAYASIYEGYGKEMEDEMEDDEECGDKEETPKMKGKKKEKKEKEEKENEMKEEVDLFDYLLEYLVAEGYAHTNKSALAIMANMSEEWRQSIVEQMTGGPTDSPSDNKTWNKGQTLKDPRAQKIYNKMTGPNPVKLPPA